MRNKDKSKTKKLYEQLVERFVKWAETRSDIREAIIVGSRARIDHPADEWADLDIMVVTTDPKRYTSTSDWIKNVGKPLLTFLEPTATGKQMERRVLFEGMLDVDFAIFPEKEFRRRSQQFQQGEIPLQMAAQILDVFGRGMRVILDKDGILTQLQMLIPSIETPPPHPPTQNEFLEVVNDFLYHAIWTAKKLGRGELWTANFCLDSYMKWKCLLRMIEWHTRATRGWTHDIWHNGRFLEEWANPQVLKGLQNAFAHYDEEDIRHGLLATMDLFRRIAMETAEKLSYPYPTKTDERVTEWIRTRLSGKERAQCTLKHEKREDAGGVST